MRMIHTKWRITEENLEHYCAEKNREVSIWRYLGNVDRDKLVAYAKSQAGKRYDVLTLFVQAVYILSKKKIWLGYNGKDAEINHVCSEFAAWCYYYSTQEPPFYRPWLVTANDIADSYLFHKLGPGERIRPGDVGLVHTSKSWLAWAIRRFTNSHWNHAIVII